VNTRQRWQALQGHLAAARAALDRGEPANALDDVQRALAIDPDFLAAQALLERIMALGVYPPLATAVPAGIGDAAVDSDIPAPSSVPTVNTVAIDDVDEVIDLPLVRPTREEPPVRTVFITSSTLLAPAPTRMTREPRRPLHAGRWAVAAATLAAGVLFASYIDDTITSQSAQPSTSPTAPLPAATAPTSGQAPLAPGTLGTFGGKVVTPITEPIRLAPPKPTDEAPPEPSKRTMPAPTAEALVPEPRLDQPTPAATTATYLPPAAAPIVPTAPVQTASLPPPAQPAYLPPPVLPASAPPAAAAVPASIEPRAEIRTNIDETSIRSLLQRYRSAYDELDASSASAVWPSVDQRALARAFDGLQSQTLTFEACSVQLRGETAAAVCRGTARYVPKVGNRDPRTEPLVWTFTLHKAAGDWKIQSARAQR